MKKAFILIAAAAAFSTSAWADCTYPRAPGKMPDGNTAPREELLATKKLVDQYNADMNVYLACIKTEHDTAVTKMGATGTEEQKQQMAAMYTQKNDAAVDELQAVAERFNEQVRAYRAKNPPGSTEALLTPAEAEERITRNLPSLPIESLPVGQCAGAILRENIYAERDQPPFDRVSMDGVALVSSRALAGGRRFRIQAMQAAGDPPLTLSTPDDCIEIMTGAMLPTGCDAVVPVERINVIDGYAELHEDVVVEARQNIHTRASDQRQGALLLTAGVRLEAPDVAVAAGAGMARLRVSQQPAFMVISTGNELIEPGEPIETWQLRRSNAYALTAALRRRGFLRVADDHLPDDADLLQARIKLHLDSYDVLILSGGVSMGKLDLVPAALAACGVQQIFHKVAQRPGKPFWFGTAPNGTAVFALPGNPVSTLVCLARYVIPAIDHAMGARDLRQGEKIALSAPVKFTPPLAGFLPVTVETDEWGRPWATTVPHNGSGDYAALAGTSGFVELPPGPNIYARGFVTRLYRW